MRVVSLFSGAGGLDYGLAKAGLEIVWANDIFADAIETYRRNVGDHVDARDICEIPSREIPDSDIVVGGFPCQGFSVANWSRRVGDERNLLYRQMVRVVADKQPSFFIAENVKGIISLGRGEALKAIIADFEDCGYSTVWGVLNCADYGVPQKRLRFVMLGARRDLGLDAIPFPPRPTHEEPGGPTRNPQRKPWVSVGEALAHIPEPSRGDNIPNHEYSRYKLRFNGHLGHRFVYPDKPAPTVTGRGDERGGVVVLHHPNNRRRMSCRELATVQSFPNDFVFAGTRSSVYRQIANAVPPLLGIAIGEALLSIRSPAYQDAVAL